MHKIKKKKERKKADKEDK